MPCSPGGLVNSPCGSGSPCSRLSCLTTHSLSPTQNPCLFTNGNKAGSRVSSTTPTRPFQVRRGDDRDTERRPAWSKTPSTPLDSCVACASTPSSAAAPPPPVRPPPPPPARAEREGRERGCGGGGGAIIFPKYEISFFLLVLKRDINDNTRLF